VCININYLLAMYTECVSILINCLLCTQSVSVCQCVRVRVCVRVFACICMCVGGWVGGGGGSACDLYAEGAKAKKSRSSNPDAAACPVTTCLGFVRIFARASCFLHACRQST
jgi:hypothetical protein